MVCIEKHVMRSGMKIRLFTNPCTLASKGISWIPFFNRQIKKKFPNICFKIIRIILFESIKKCIARHKQVHVSFDTK